jgi:hypothetical protein
MIDKYLADPGWVVPVYLIAPRLRPLSLFSPLLSLYYYYYLPK